MFILSSGDQALIIEEAEQENQVSLSLLHGHPQLLGTGDWPWVEARLEWMLKHPTPTEELWVLSLNPSILVSVTPAWSLRFKAGDRLIGELSLSENDRSEWLKIVSAF
jgi:hypothetical protein